MFNQLVAKISKRTNFGQKCKNLATEYIPLYKYGKIETLDFALNPNFWKFPKILQHKMFFKIWIFGVKINFETKLMAI